MSASMSPMCGPYAENWRADAKTPETPSLHAQRRHSPVDSGSAQLVVIGIGESAGSNPAGRRSDDGARRLLAASALLRTPTCSAARARPASGRSGRGRPTSSVQRPPAPGRHDACSGSRSSLPSSSRGVAAYRRAASRGGHEALTLVDQWLQRCCAPVLPRVEVVVQRRLGDSETVCDVLQAGALHALLREQLPGHILDTLPGSPTAVSPR